MGKAARRGKEKNMTKLFTVNGKSYRAKEFDFNFLCDLENKNLSLEDIDKKPLSLIRAYIAFSAGITEEQAGYEVEAHLEKGGKFNDVVDVMSEQMQDSGFFRSINKGTETEDGETSEASQKNRKKA
jgi:hypothetical protein